MLNKNIVTMFLLLCLFQINQANAEDNFFIEKGGQFELCQELKQVLNSEENKDYAVPYIRYSPFKIPKKFKNFLLPKWKDVPIENLSQYMKNTDELFKQFKIAQYDFKQYKMQKTNVNFDNYGEDEVLIRLINKNDEFDISYSDLSDNSYHFISDMGEESSEYLYKSAINVIHWGKFIFYYKGKIFYSSGSTDRVYVIEPNVVKKSRGNKASFYSEEVCVVDLVPEKAEIAKKRWLYDYNLKTLKHLKQKEPSEERKKVIKIREKEIKTLEGELKSYGED